VRRLGSHNPLRALADAGWEAGSEGDGDTVHVFSLASGLLYERFLRIMMRTVLQRTKSKVKFWLLANFLSPTFRAATARLAAALGCEIELVEYAWPPWLRAQTEKQRLIWGFKVLFLDVLFPLSLKRVIYIDADQIVQGDVGELWRLDLGGAAVGMTPFCQDAPNEATMGFRFWADGYWKGHLGGRPYHISALFVVDLELFRAAGFGDMYRDTYNALTADPNSLSNLDQDLPNYLQAAAPIHSLPEAWLWCETWCSKSTKAAAKTIDLCNNPLTKEPKLDQAQRIGGARWAEIDAEMETLLAGDKSSPKEEL
jgi:UDP-glucose:glycoprotein glucosyltransferase